MVYYCRSSWAETLLHVVTRAIDANQSRRVLDVSKIVKVQTLLRSEIRQNKFKI